jgi:HSP20 family protein
MTTRDLVIGNVVPSNYRSPFPSIMDSKVWNNMIEDFFGDNISNERFFDKQTVPYDVIQNTDKDGNATSYELVYCLSGYNKDQINVDVEKDLLKISVQKTETTEEDNKNYIHKGIAQRSIEASYNISNIDKNSIDASFENGVLKIELPVKKELLEKPKTIKIK